MTHSLQAQIDVLHAADAIGIGQTAYCDVRVKNVGHQHWPVRGPHPIHVSYHWLMPTGDYLVYDGLRTPLSADLQPGQEAVVRCGVIAPHTPGQLLLEFDLVQEHVSWFKERGSETAQISCQVMGAPLEGFEDYCSVWRQADLDRDYWNIVGPGSKDEYEALGRGKRQGLIDLGLTPQSRVLDVGCGTGQLAEALEDYLSPQGLYYGTDIAEEAIAFCRKRFRRPNFVFVQNETTHVPIEEPCFDFITLHSVFTHMYPEEIRALLEDLQRLLAPKGLILADVFVSPKVDRFAGTRATVEINEAYLLEMFARTGLRSELLHRLASHNEIQRLFWKFAHAPAGSPA